MLKLLKSIWLGAVLIVVASGLLLFSDLDRRQDNGRRPAKPSLPRLAVMQWASTDLLDHTVAGMIEGLRKQGFEQGRSAEIRFFNASGDNTTGNVMARDLAGGAYQHGREFRQLRAEHRQQRILFPQNLRGLQGEPVVFHHQLLVVGAARFFNIDVFAVGAAHHLFR